MTLRVFFPNPDVARISSDADFATTSGVTFTTGRFGSTTYASGGGTVVYAFLRDFDSAHPVRVAFDYLMNSSGTSPIQAVPGTSSPSTTPSASSALFYFTLNSSTNRLRLVANSTHEIPFQLQPNAWYHIEMELKVDDSAGYVKVWINNSLKLDVSGVDTKGLPTTPAQIWYGIGRNCACPLIWDDSGTPGDDLTGYIGDFTPVPLTPNADTAQADSTVTGAATRAGALADTATGSYVSFAADADYDLYEFSDTALTGTVAAVIVTADGYLIGNGEAYLKAVAKSGAVEVVGAQQSTMLTTGNTARNVLTVAFPTDPNTDAAWSVSTVNAAKFGLKAVVP